MRGGGPYKTHKKANSSTNYRDAGASTSQSLDGSRYPTTVLRPARLNAIDKGSHPTQKPIALLEYLIRTYTLADDLVLDCCAGSASTMVAAVNTGRRFTGMELDRKYHAIGLRRIAAAFAQPPTTSLNAQA